jgi:glutathione peroxidase
MNTAPRRSLLLSLPIAVVTALVTGLTSTVLLAASTPGPQSLYDFEVRQINAPKSASKEDAPVKLSQYRGKVLLIVNTASRCGFTKQYQGLEALYEKYGKEGFVILGFPSNDYGAQEPGSNAEIKDFCERNFKVTFPLFEKAPVSGKRIQPVYAYLTEHAPWKGAVGWNFEKFLITRDGKIAARYRSKVTPEDPELRKAIETALKAK